MISILMFFCLRLVEEISIDKESFFVYVFIFIYLIAISVFGDKYLDQLDDIKKHLTRFKLGKISKTQFTNFHQQKKKEIHVFLKKMFFVLVFIYIIHLTTLHLVLSFNKSIFLSATIILFSALLMLFIVYWLKGSSTVNSDYRFPGPTRL